MLTLTRFLLLCAAVLVLPAIAASQTPPPLTVERIWTQDASGNTKTAFTPGDTIQFTALLNNEYDRVLPSATLTITTSFYNNTKTVDIPPGRSTWTWNAAAPSPQNNTTVTLKAFNSSYRVLAISSASLAVGAITEDGRKLKDSRYDPRHFGIPDIIGGYFVFAVLTEDNYVCMKPGEKRLVLQSPQLTIEDGPRDFPKELIEQVLQARHLTDSAKWEWRIVGPALTREQVVRQLERSYRFFKAHDCPTLELPLGLPQHTARSAVAPAAPGTCPPSACTPSDANEIHCNPPSAAYTIIQNLDSTLGAVNTNAQSVILVAPTVGDNQDTWFSGCDWSKCDLNNWPPCPKGTCLFMGGYSALLNNGMTDAGYFLQVWLHFTNRNALLTDPSSWAYNNPPISDCVGIPDPDPGNPFSPNGLGSVVFAGAQSDQCGNTKQGALAAHALCVPYIAGHHYYTTISHSTGGPWWTCAGDLENPATYNCRHHPDATGTYQCGPSPARS